MPKVILLNPNSHIIDREKDHYSIMEHLGLGLLAASLEQNNFTVKIIDAYAHNKDQETIIKEIISFNPDYLGITCNYINFPEAIDVAEKISRHSNPPFTFLGGEHCTYSAEQILRKYPFIRTIVRGEGEVTTIELLKNTEKMEVVHGIYFRDPTMDRIIKNDERSAITDLDKLPFARRDTLDFCKNHQKTTAIGILAQRGCNFNCHFCNAHNFFRLGGGNPIRRRSPQNVADELLFLYQNYYVHGNIEKVYFYDANFLTGSKASKKWAHDLAAQIIERDIVMPFEIYLRGDSISSKDQDLIDHLKQAGLESVFIGIESFDQDALDFFGKNISAESTENCLSMLIGNDILGPTQGVIMFNPYSSYDGLRKTAELLVKYNLASFWNLSQKLQIFPGVKLIEKLKKEDLIIGYNETHKVYSYRFRNREIQSAADFLMEMNNEPAVIKDNALPRQVKSEIQKLSLELKSCDSINELLKAKKKIIDMELKSINAINMKFFMDILELCREKKCPDELNTHKQVYLRELESRLNALEKEYSDALMRIHQMLAA